MPWTAAAPCELLKLSDMADALHRGAGKHLADVHIHVAQHHAQDEGDDQRDDLHDLRLTETGLAIEAQEQQRQQRHGADQHDAETGLIGLVAAASNTAFEPYVTSAVAILAFVLAVTNILCPFMVKFILTRHPADEQPRQNTHKLADAKQ